MKKLVIICFIFGSHRSHAQELFVFTEPASNMAAKSVGLRLNNYFYGQTNASKTACLLIPEIMVGVSKKLMVHGDLFIGAGTGKFSFRGGSAYAKYRLLSNDGIQKHFRVAAFARLSINNSNTYTAEINMYGYNSGWETGIVATQLLHKVALSSGLSFANAVNSGGNKFMPGEGQAINYTISAGKLMFPAEYRDYRQVNFNLLAELLSQYNTGSKKYYIDAAPAVQMIFNSQSRIDIGYRMGLTSTYQRTSAGSVFIRLEHNLFNVW